MREEDLLRFQWVADPQLSPDGEWIAFTLVAVDTEADEYRTNLWLARVPAAGAAPEPPRPLTFSGRDAQPRWSPDGARLAFGRSPARGEPPQLHVLPLGGGEARPLTALGKGASSPAWSPDGRRIAFLSGHNPDVDVPGRKPPPNAPARVVTRPEFRWNNEGFTDWEHLEHLWVVDVAAALAAPPRPAEAPAPAAGAAPPAPAAPAPGAPRRLTRGTRCKEWAPAWSRDGRWILYCTDRREQPWFGVPAEDNDVRAVSPDLEAPGDGDDAAVVADIAGPIAQFVEGPGGRLAAVGGVRPATPNSYDRGDLLLFEGAWPCTAPRVLTAGADLHVGEGISSDQHPPRGGGALPLGFAADGRIVFVHARHGAGLLAACDPASGRIEALTGPEHEVIAGSLSADGRRVALVLGSLASPGELCVYDLAARTLVKLFDPNAALLAEAKLGEVEEIRYPSFDGAEIQAWIVKPPDFDPGRRHPLILEIHGGPHTAYGVGFFHEFRVLAAAGYVVLYTNPRGSTSYGQAFANVIQYRFPGDDARDLLAGVDHLVARGYVDERRVGVTGGSGGGLLTNWLITQTPRFAAAITQRCVTDWAGMWYSSDFAMFSPFWFRGAPWEEPADFAARSPGTFVDRIETPLLVLHSEEDWRTPIAQGEILFRALVYRRRPVAMVRFPGENHELSRSGAPSRRVQNQQHIRRWFDHWLQGVPAPEYGLPAPR